MFTLPWIGRKIFSPYPHRIPIVPMLYPHWLPYLPRSSTHRLDLLSGRGSHEFLEIKWLEVGRIHEATLGVCTLGDGHHLSRYRGDLPEERGVR